MIAAAARAGAFALLALAPAARPQTKPAPVVVFAAASLAAPFEAIRALVAAGTPGLAIEIQLASSSQLVAQLREGARADVFASADEPTMAKVVDAGWNAEPPRVFARNELRIAVERGNPKRVRGLGDLGRSDLRVALGAPEVPIGRYARDALAKAGVVVKPVSEELHVKALASKVALGEIDAAIVYATDVRAAARALEGVAIPPGQNVAARYPIARLRGGRSEAGAKSFVEAVLSAKGKSLLAEHGFLPP